MMGTAAKRTVQCHAGFFPMVQCKMCFRAVEENPQSLLAKFNRLVERREGLVIAVERFEPCTPESPGPGALWVQLNRLVERRESFFVAAEGTERHTAAKPTKTIFRVQLKRLVARREGFLPAAEDVECPAPTAPRSPF